MHIQHAFRRTVRRLTLGAAVGLTLALPLAALPHAGAATDRAVRFAAQQSAPQSARPVASATPDPAYAAKAAAKPKKGKKGKKGKKPRCAGLKATIVGTDKSEKIKGTSGDDVIVARGGKDRILGRGGTDVICGGSGNDRIESGSGPAGLLYGEGGDDAIVAQDGGIGLYGGPGNDILSTTKEGTLLEGGDGNDTLWGGAFPDVVDGGPGNDTIDVAGGDDVDVDGGPGNDTIDGDEGNDTLLAGDGADHVLGGAGDDTLRGGPGNDQLDAGAGLDVVYGDDGDDSIRPGTGVGGLYYGGFGNDGIVAGDGGQGLYGGSGDDMLATRFEGTLLQGDSGNDWITGSSYADTIDAGDGDDHVDAEAGDDIEVEAGPGKDTCIGGAGRDRCDGGAPGGPGNTPEDVDECDAEVKVSCKSEEFPERYEIKLTGHQVDVGDNRRETEDWNVTMVVVRHGNRETSHMWTYESATGSYAAEGYYDKCTFSHSGTFDRDFSGDLVLATAFDLYWLDVVASGDGTRTTSCEGGGGSSGTAGFQVWAATEGGPEAIPWDRTKPTITGTWHEEEPDGDTIDVDWVITPLGEDPA